MLTALIPKVFYADLEVGLDLFVDGIGMQISHRDDDLIVVSKDNAKLHLVKGSESERDERPELSLETDSIDADFAGISARRPDLLHPNLKKVKLREWGAREFALLDRTNVCVVFRSWAAA